MSETQRVESTNELRSPFPVPFGWFVVAWSNELAVGEVKPLEYWGEQLVVWRAEDGTPSVNDAFCPHLGAHFAFGGSVQGNDLACPFHGWRFNSAGENTLIPYSERINKKGCVRSYPTIERNGLVMAWYHPDAAEPMWEIPEVPEFNDPDNFTEMVTREYIIEAAWQELAENGVDAAHFRYVHHTEQVPELESYELDGPFTRMRSIQKFPTPRGVVDGRIDADSFGPGFSCIRFSGIIDTVLMGTNTPIGPNKCHMRFSFTVRKLGDDEALNSSVGQAFVDEVHNQVLEDKPIWENKAHLVRPALADTDGPFMKFRNWAGQFYTEPLDDSALRYVPTETHDFVPVETASRKHGSDPFAKKD
jgi:phenylpropionate dioxygenase-like ring-hydroxylating dioxygenase large terminal subunit